MLSIFRFTIRDVLWLTVMAALACGWWIERGKASRMSREREEAIAKWHDVNGKWVEATRLIPPERNSSGIGGGAGMGGRGLSGRAPAAASSVADKDDDDDE
jgi:hypothetical protein